MNTFKPIYWLDPTGTIILCQYGAGSRGNEEEFRNHQLSRAWVTSSDLSYSGIPFWEIVSLSEGLQSSYLKPGYCFSLKKPPLFTFYISVEPIFVPVSISNIFWWNLSLCPMLLVSLYVTEMKMELQEVYFKKSEIQFVNVLFAFCWLNQPHFQLDLTGDRISDYVLVLLFKDGFDIR